MDKIYRRETQRGNTPKKKKDEHARRRNQILNFRVTPAERGLIEKRIALSGLSRSQFFIQSCLYQTILVKGNVKSFEAIRNEMNQIRKRLTEIQSMDEIEAEESVAIKTILEILNAVYGK